jgi:hypothetical protein
MADGAHEPLGEGVRSGCSRWCADHPHVLGSEHVVEVSGELRVSVSDEQPVGAGNSVTSLTCESRMHDPSVYMACRHSSCDF